MKITKHLFFLLLSLSLLMLFGSCGTSRNNNLPSNGEVQDLGYGKVKKDRSTSSVSSVKQNEDAPILSLTDMLARVPGVQVTGRGAGTTILIRGASSLTLSNEPLFVVDGIQVGMGYSAVANINPMEIENISVLKGGSATAMYGTQGANGVIVIKTKK